MRRFLLYRFLAARRKARYWRKMARALEARLEAETWRNRGREDILCTASVRAIAGWAPEPRIAPARPMEPLHRAVAHSPKTAQSEMESLSETEQVEWEIFKEDAEVNQIPLGKARKDFLGMLRFRKAQEM